MLSDLEVACAENGMVRLLYCPQTAHADAARYVVPLSQRKSCDAIAPSAGAV